MLATEHGEFQSVMRRLAGTFDRALNAELMETYWDALRDVPLPQFRARAASHIRDGKFFPKPRDLRYNPDGERRVTDTAAQPPVSDLWVATLNRNLLVFLRNQKGALPEDRLAAVISAKNRIAAQMREGGVTPAEFAGMLPGIHAEFARVAGVAP